jgi:hypothetical protein
MNEWAAFLENPMRVLQWYCSYIRRFIPVCQINSQRKVQQVLEAACGEKKPPGAAPGGVLRG